jgi:hypothetical protein
VVKNKQLAGLHKTIIATNHDHKETRNLQHRDQTTRQCPITGKILKILRKHLNKELVHKTFR